MGDKDDMRPYDVGDLERISNALKFVAQFASREQLEGMGFLPETAQAIILVRECFRGDWW